MTGKRTMRATALGIVPLIVPRFMAAGGYYVHCFSTAGNWRSSGTTETKAQAIQERKRIFAHHKQLAAERQKWKKK